MKKPKSPSDEIPIGARIFILALQGFCLFVGGVIGWSVYNAASQRHDPTWLSALYGLSAFGLIFLLMWAITMGNGGEDTGTR